MTLLLSIDLEDVRDWVENGEKYQPRLRINTERYLAFFDQIGVKATFFVVGSIARQNKALITMIAGLGHELACHSDRHIQLDKQSRRQFIADIKRNKETVENICGQQVFGYRAPTFSLTEQTMWAHELLSEAGFTYSSSVLPAKNILYGWENFGEKCRRMASGIWEIPMTLHSLPFFRIPICGGVYLRVFPYWLTRYSVNHSMRTKLPIVSYLHPYDIDQEQERFMHPDLHGNHLLNALMYIGRGSVFKKLAKLKRICEFLPYGHYVRMRLERGIIPDNVAIENIGAMET
ncbi:MAG TPA: polysaccharide deacetylase [Desulfobulbaceae bacterium]|nr:polysaccharide deacetylase [Desulfobulbaceae bacterium]